MSNFSLLNTLFLSILLIFLVRLIMSGVLPCVFFFYFWDKRKSGRRKRVLEQRFLKSRCLLKYNETINRSALNKFICSCIWLLHQTFQTILTVNCIHDHAGSEFSSETRWRFFFRLLNIRRTNQPAPDTHHIRRPFVSKMVDLGWNATVR